MAMLGHAPYLLPARLTGRAHEALARVIKGMDFLAGLAVLMFGAARVVVPQLKLEQTPATPR